MKAKILVISVLVILIQTKLVLAYPGESIVRDGNGDYVVTYWNGANLMKMTFSPATKIDPKVRSSFNVSANNLIGYRYSVKNAAVAKQPISSIGIRNITQIYGSRSLPPITSSTVPQDAIAAVMSQSAAVIKPNEWDGIALGDPKNASAYQVGWHFSTGFNPKNRWGGVMPGSEVSGFGYSSFDLPGVLEMNIEGEVENHGTYEDEGPDPADSAIFEQLQKIEQNDFVSRNVAAPAIAIPIPFDAALLLDRIRTEMQTWLNFKTGGYNGNVPPDKKIFLLDAAFAAKLDGLLSSAANAFRMNQPKVAREQIEVVRKLLAKEHHNLDHDDEDDEDTEEHKRATRFTIDRLAARVLDFDLRYVLKRTEREHEDHEQKKR